LETQIAKGVCQKETILTQYQKGFFLETGIKNQQVAFDSGKKKFIIAESASSYDSCDNVEP
jgi:hypothetical protein